MHTFIHLIIIYPVICSIAIPVGQNQCICKDVLRCILLNQVLDPIHLNVCVSPTSVYYF